MVDAGAPTEWGLCDTGVPFWKPYGGCGVDDAVKDVYTPGAVVALDTASAVLTGDP